MKKTSAILIILAIIAALPAFAFAEGTPHTIEEYDISLVIPEGYRLLTPDISPDDPLLDIYGITIEDVQDMFNTMPLYMDAVRTDGGGEITVTIQESTLPDYSELDSGTLEALNQEFAALGEEMGITVTSFDICEYAGMPFARSSFESDLLMDTGLQYYTVWGGHSYSFAMHTYAAETDEAQREIMHCLMESVKFNAYEAAPAKAPSESFLYTDTDSGASFTVPAGWIPSEDSLKVYGVHSAAFVLEGSKAAGFLYSSEDLWDEYTPTQKLFMTRRKISNSLFTSSDVADMFSVSFMDVEKVTLNGNQYFRVPFTQNASRSGAGYTMDATALLRVQDARIYLFIYSGVRTTDRMATFEEMVSSMNYPETPKGAAPIVYILIVAAAIAALIVILAVRAKKKGRRLAEEAAEAERKRRLAEIIAEEEARRLREEEENRQREAAAPQEECIPCPKCGSIVEPGARFCGACGEKMPAEE